MKELTEEQPQSGEDLACRPPHSFNDENSYDPTLQAIPTPGQGCLYNGSTDVSVTRSQQNFVIEVPTTSNGIDYIWTGDRWQQAPDGIKGHDPQYWIPLEFHADGRIKKVHWSDNFTIDVKTS